MKKFVKLLNISHKLTEDQLAQLTEMGFEEFSHPDITELVAKASNLKIEDNIATLARELVDTVWELCPHATVLLPVGSPVFLTALAVCLRGTSQLFSHTDRESVEVQNADGSVTKTFVFKHKGFHVVDEDGEIDFFPLNK
ncbi:hypothetical protein [Caudoviricetes sp.]|nr:hypothetical protein [Caudoviricetes sp.]